VHLHCFCNTRGKSFVFPPDEGIHLRCVAEHALGCFTLLCSLMEREEGRERDAPQTLSIQKFMGMILEKCLLCPVEGITESQNSRGWKGPLWVI